MEKNEYICDECGYRYFGCGGFDVGMLRDGLQTISCEQCEELLDVPLSADFINRYIDIVHEPRGSRQDRALEEHFTTLVVTCPVESWHTVHFWTRAEYRARRGRDEIIALCPRCEGHMSEGDMHLIYN